MDVRVGRHGGPDVDADGRGVDKLYMPDSLCGYLLHMRGQLFSGEGCLKPGNQALQDHGGLAGPGNAGDCAESPLREVRLQGLYGMDAAGGQVNSSQREHLLR